MEQFVGFLKNYWFLVLVVLVVIGLGIYYGVRAYKKNSDIRDAVALIEVWNDADVQQMSVFQNAWNITAQIHAVTEALDAYVTARTSNINVPQTVTALKAAVEVARQAAYNQCNTMNTPGDPMTEWKNEFYSLCQTTKARY